MTMKIKKLDPRAKIPTRSTAGSAGMDLCALLDEPLTVAPGGRVTVPTGIAIRLPSPETVGLIFARSGLAVKHGLTLSNCVGVIDSDYTGELRVGMVNLSQEAYTCLLYTSILFPSPNWAGRFTSTPPWWNFPCSALTFPSNGTG